METLLRAVGAVRCVACGLEAVDDPTLHRSASRLGIHARLCRSCDAELPSALQPIVPPAGVTMAWAFASYAGPAGAVVRRGKYGANPSLLDAMGSTMADAWSRTGPEAAYDAVVAVPSFWWRMLLRGFNPAERIARPLGRSLGLGTSRGLVRTRGRSQAGAARGDRSSNARGMYRARAPLQGRVLLVDDVLTTGATASACACELLCAGASRVDLLVAAASTRPRVAES